MRTSLVGLAVITAIAAPISMATPANAATTGSGTGAMHFVTHYQGTDYIHDGTTAYTCDAAGNVNFSFIGAREDFTGNGSGTIIATTVTFTGTRPTDSYSYTIAGKLTGAPNAEWELTASADSMGQVGASAEGSSPAPRTAPSTRSGPSATTASTSPVPPRPESGART